MVNLFILSLGLLVLTSLLPSVGVLMTLLLYAGAAVIFVSASAKTWFGLMLYLVYLGAVLVLFFYIFLLVPNPFYKNLLFRSMMPLSFTLYLICKLELPNKTLSSYSISESFISKQMTISLLIMVLLLLSILWMMTKLGPFQSATLRPWY